MKLFINSFFISLFLLIHCFGIKAQTVNSDIDSLKNKIHFIQDKNVLKFPHYKKVNVNKLKSKTNKFIDSLNFDTKIGNIKKVFIQTSALNKLDTLKRKKIVDSTFILSKINSVQKIIKHPLRFNQLSASNKKENYLTIFNKKKETLNFANNKAKQIKNPLSQKLNTLKKAKLSFNFTIESQNRYQSSQTISIINNNLQQNITQPKGFVSAINFIGNLNAFGIPLNFNYSTNKSLAYNPLSLNNNLFKFDFDATQFNGLLSNDLEQYYDLRKQVFEGADLSGYTSSQLSTKLKKMQTEEMDKLSINNLQKYLGNIDNLDELLRLDEKPLREKLLSEVKIKTADVDNQIKNETTHQRQKNSLQNNAQVDTVLNTIRQIKQELAENGYDIEKILQMQKELNKNNGNLGNSETAKTYVVKKTKNGIQGILSKISALKIGSFGNKIPGNMQNRDLFISGTSVSFKTSEMALTAGYGGLNDIGSLKDASFQSSVFNTPKNITYISAEKKGGIFNNVKLSVVSSFNKESNNNAFALPTISANNMAFTASKALNLAYIGRLNIDVSKSSTLYKNDYNFGNDVFLNRQTGQQNNSNSDLFEALSFGINHRLEIKKINFSDNVYFNYSGMGYQNPANNGFSNARMRVGGNIRKLFYKNKLSITARTDLKNIPISFTSNDKWQNLQFQFDTKYTFSKKFSMDVKYTSNTSNKQINNQTTPIYGLQKIQVDGNANYKIGKHYSISHFTLGTQSYTNTYSTNANPISQTSLTTTGGVLPPSNGSNMLMLNYIHSLLLRTNTLTATVFYNRELSPTKLIGNMLNADFAYQYKLFEALNLSTGFTYLDNNNIARQAGIRQTVQVFAGSNFDVDTFLDVRKNLITPIYPDLYATARAEVMLRYHIKNKK